jgi:hypothetical protein
MRERCSLEPPEPEAVHRTGRLFLTRAVGTFLECRNSDKTLVGFVTSTTAIVTAFFTSALAATVAGFGTALAAFATLTGVLSTVESLDRSDRVEPPLVNRPDDRR